LDDGRSCHFAIIGNNPKPIARMTSIRKQIQRPSQIGWRRIAWKSAELAVCAVSIKSGASGKCDALIILFDNIIAENCAYCSH
jgi:hypothetical protein